MSPTKSFARHRFLAAGYRPVIAATKKKLLNGVIHDFYPGWNTYIEKPGYLIRLRFWPNPGGRRFGHLLYPPTIVG